MKKILSIIVAIITSITFISCSSNKTIDTSDIKTLENSFRSAIGVTNQGDPFEALNEVVGDYEHFSFDNHPGKFTLYSMNLSSGYSNYINEVNWHSNEELTQQDYVDAIEMFLAYYGIDSDINDISSETTTKFSTNNYNLEVSGGDGEHLSIKMSPLYERYKLPEIAALNAMDYLKKSLKDPSSLQVFGLYYSDLLSDKIAIKIDYSGRNGFGGVTRDNYYIEFYSNSNGFPLVYNSIADLYHYDTLNRTFIDKIDYDWTADLSGHISIELKAEDTTSSVADPIVQKWKDGKLYAMKDGKIVTDYQGVAPDEDGNYYYITYGGVNTDFKGRYSAQNEKIYEVEKGRATEIESETNSSTSTTSTTSVTSLTKNAQISDSDIEVQKMADSSWSAVKNGVVVSEFTGILSNEYGTWYIKNGKVDFSFTGDVDYNGNKYKVEKGKVIG